MAQIQLLDPAFDDLIAENERLRQTVLEVLSVLQEVTFSSRSVDHAIALLKEAKDGANKS